MRCQYTCRGHSTSCRRPLLAPLRLISLCQIACSSGVRAKPCSPHALRALLCCDFAVRSESAGCSCAHFPAGLRLDCRVPSRVDSQSEFRRSEAKTHNILEEVCWHGYAVIALRIDGSWDPPRQGWDATAMSSRWTQIAQQNRSAGEPARAYGADEDRRRSSGPSSCESGERTANRARRAVGTHPGFEHAIWQSEMSLNGASGDKGTLVPTYVKGRRSRVNLIINYLWRGFI